MSNRIIEQKTMEKFKHFLLMEEKSDNTIEKYVRDAECFAEYIGCAEVDKESVIMYKNKLIEKGYANSSINSIISSLNKLFSLLDWNDCKVKYIKEQRQMYCAAEKELTKSDYLRLVNTAKANGNTRLSLIIQTICATGIRVSELKYITVEAIQRGEAKVTLKGKTRRVFIVDKLRKKLLKYISKKHIKHGVVFVTKWGNPINRSNIWREMKNLCDQAGVNPNKVFPHNLRHLFARSFYKIEKDVAKLADILGHSSINTTRIYIVTTAREHRMRMEQMRLII